MPKSVTHVASTKVADFGIRKLVWFRNRVQEVKPFFLVALPPDKKKSSVVGKKQNRGLIADVKPWMNKNDDLAKEEDQSIRLCLLACKTHHRGP